MVLATVVLYSLSAVRYVQLAWRRKIDPVPATWVLMFVVFALSCWMYWKSPNHSFAGNIGNIAGFFNICLIVCGVVGRHVRDNTLRVAFNPFQKKCLAAGGLIVVFWLFTRNSQIAYLLTQVIALVAYTPTVVRLWTADRNTESLFLWGIVFVACLTALYPAVLLHDKLAWIYLGRAIPSTLVVIVLILRLTRRESLAMSHR